MSAARLLCIIALLLSYLAAPLAAEPILKDVHGKWQVDYVDLELGQVSGEADIDANAGTAEVRYVHPTTGETFNLTSRSMSLNGAILTIELEGQSPAPRRKDGRGAPEIDYVLEKPSSEFTVRRGENQATLPVLGLPATSSKKVTLELEVTDNLLSGTWRYPSHWFIGRATDGLGRDGSVEIDNSGVAWTYGPESWRRPIPFVVGAFALHDQLGLKLFSNGTSAAYYAYPFPTGGWAESKSRYIYVFGVNLPRDYSRTIKLESVDPGVSYIEIARMSDSGSPNKGKLLSEGRRKLQEMLQARLGSTAVLDRLDAIVLRADLSPEAVPGTNSFLFEGQEVGWQLQFGDNTAKLRVVRPIGRDDLSFEASSYLFPGELVKIEVETALQLPVDSIPVIVGIDGKPSLIGDGEGIQATRDPRNPRVYRTDYIWLKPVAGGATVVDMRAGGGLARLPVRQGTRLSAVIGRPGLISIPPAIVSATVFETTGDSAVGGDWGRWMGVAAECASVSTDGAALDTKNADTISKLLINAGSSRVPIPAWMETKVSVGQHTAMLMLRDTFVRLLENNRAQFARIVTDEEVLAFRRQFEPVVRQGATPLARIEVDGLNGVRTEFYWSFEKSILAKLRDGQIDETETWVINVTRQALRQYQELMSDASARAQAVDACDVEALLRLTGQGFEPVASIAKSKLMTPLPGLGLWAPHFRARGWIDTVAILGEQLSIQDKTAAEDRKVTLMAVGLATIPVAIVGSAVGSAAAVVATFIIDIFDVAYSSYSEIDAKWAEDDEVMFAKGAADVLGMARLESAEANRRSWSTVFVQLGYIAGPAVVGVGFDLSDLRRAFSEGLILRKATRGRAAVMAMSNIDPITTGQGRAPDISRLVGNAIEESRQADEVAAAQPIARQLAESLESSASAEPPLSLNFDDLADVADNIVDDIGALLDGADSAAIRSAVDELAVEAARKNFIEDVAVGFETPDWATQFKPETFDRLRRHLRRPDVMAMAEAATERVAQQLDASDLRRARYAQEILESEAGLDIESFERRIERLLERQDEPIGIDYYRQASPDDLQTTQMLRDAGWTARTIASHGDHLEISIRDPDGHVGAVGRGYDAETGTYTMKYAFRRFDFPGENAVPGPIRGKIEGALAHPLTPRGTPSIQFFTMRLMNALNIPYGASKGIRQAEMSTIINARTIAQINWFKRTYYPTTAWSEIPAEDLSRALQLTHSGRYGAENLAVAGYKVKSARLDLEGLGDALERWSMTIFKKDYEPEGGEAFDAMLSRFGLEPETRVFGGFDIIFEVEPW